MIIEYPWLRGNFFKNAIKFAMLYGIKCWAVKKQHVHKINVAEMIMFSWIS